MQRHRTRSRTHLTALLPSPLLPPLPLPPSLLLLCREILANTSAAALESFYHAMATQQFDFLLSSDIIEHLPDPYYFFQHSLTWIRPGGTHVFTAPFLATQYDELTLAAQQHNGSVFHFHRPVYHSHYLHPGGVLTYTLFSPAMVDRLCSVGYRMLVYRLHDQQQGIIGDNAWVFAAQRPLCDKARSPKGVA